MTKQAQIQKAIRDVNKLLASVRVEAALPVHSVKDMEKALDAATAAFKKKPDDKNYVAMVQAMKEYRRAVFEEQYASQYDKPPRITEDRRRPETEYGGEERRGGDRRQAKTAASTTPAYEAAYRFWCKNGRLP